MACLDQDGGVMVVIIYYKVQIGSLNIQEKNHDVSLEMWSYMMEHYLLVISFFG